MSRSRISQAKMVGFSRLYCSILETTVGVATLGLLPPIRPGGRREPATSHPLRYSATVHDNNALSNRAGRAQRASRDNDVER